MNSVKGALCASLFFISSALANQPLVGVSWQTSSELTAIAALSEQVRYVARSVAFVEARESAVEEFTKRGFAILCLDRPRTGDRYFVADHLHFPLPQGVELVFDGGGEWALLRVEPTARLHETPHFLWPLPNNYSLKGWLDVPPRRAPKALQTASPAVAALIEEVAAARLQVHVEALALKDPALGSVPGNIRSRFAVHPEILESTDVHPLAIGRSPRRQKRSNCIPSPLTRGASSPTPRVGATQGMHQATPPRTTSSARWRAPISAGRGTKHRLRPLRRHRCTRSVGGWGLATRPRARSRRQCQWRGPSHRERSKLLAGQQLPLVHLIYRLVWAKSWDCWVAKRMPH